MKKNALITGGAGFIGSHLVKKLIDGGSRVTVLDNLSFGRKEHLPDSEDCFFVKGDIRSIETLRKVFEDHEPDRVFHLAAIHFIPYCNEHPVEAAEINIMGTRNVFDMCAEYKPARVFYASTAAVYPIRDEPNGEDSLVYPTDIYGIAKLAGEHIAELFHGRTGIDTISGRFFNAYGPNETNPHLIPEIADQLNAGKRNISLGNVEPKRDFIHTSDLSEAIVTVMESFTGGYDVYNMGTGKEFSVREIVDVFGEILDEPVNIIQEEKRIRKAERMHLVADISKIRRDFGWKPKMNLMNGLAELID